MRNKELQSKCLSMCPHYSFLNCSAVNKYMLV